MFCVLQTKKNCSEQHFTIFTLLKIDASYLSLIGFGFTEYQFMCCQCWHSGCQLTLVRACRSGCWPETGCWHCLPPVTGEQLLPLLGGMEVVFFVKNDQWPLECPVLFEWPQGANGLHQYLQCMLNYFRTINNVYPLGKFFNWPHLSNYISYKKVKCYQ